MENPNRISKAVLERGLDAHTAFEIVSIDIADIDVGENIGARLQADQAEADTRVARAKAEERRAFAIAREQEMKANVAENRARVVLAEAEVPLAMAPPSAKATSTSTKTAASNPACAVCHWLRQCLGSPTRKLGSSSRSRVSAWQRPVHACPASAPPEPRNIPSPSLAVPFEADVDAGKSGNISSFLPFSGWHRFPSWIGRSRGH